MTFAKYPVTGGGSGSGDVTGPGSSVNNGLVLWNGTGGTSIKDGGVGSANQVLVTNGTTPGFSLIVNANIDASANIALSKLAALTVDRALVSNGSGVVSASAVTATEVGYLSGVTSAIQTQINSVSSSVSGCVLKAGDTMTGNLIFDALATSAIETQFTGSATSPRLGMRMSKTGGTPQEWFAGMNSVGETNNAWFLVNVTGSQKLIEARTNNTVTCYGSWLFTSSQAITATTNQIVLGTTNTVTITSPAPAASRVYTIPDAGGAASFVMTAGTQTIGGTLTLPATVTYTSAGSIVKSGAGALTLTNASAAGLTFSGAFTLTVPATGTANLIGTAQTISAIKTHSAAIAFSGGTAANLSIWAASNVLRQRGGTSGWAVDNSTGTTITATDAGLVGIGVSPTVKLHVNTAGNTSAGGICLQNGAAQQHFWYLSSNTNSRFEIGSAAGTWDWVNSNGTLMSIGSAGALTLGPAGTAVTTEHTFNGMIRARGNNAASTNGQLRVWRETTTATNYVANFLSNVGSTESTVWRVEADGDTISSTGSYTSDIRAKKDVAPIHYGLAEILQLNPISYRWNHENPEDVFSFSAASAQQMQEIMPELVRDDGLDATDAEGNKFVAKAVYEKELISVLVKAIQELHAELQALKAS